jgi:hypothetical protein
MCRDKSPGRVRTVQRYRAAAVAGGKVWSSVGLSISADEWQAIWRQQEGLCPICLHMLRNRHDPTPQPDTRVAALDHDHAFEAAMKKAGVSAADALRRSVRGLLCAYPCNRLLVRHWTTQRLANAARYVVDMRAQEILTHG